MPTNKYKVAPPAESPTDGILLTSGCRGLDSRRPDLFTGFFARLRADFTVVRCDLQEPERKKLNE